MIDLRSDTVTRPTAAMRQAIANALVGDDALGDDPTVRLLEERVAARLGKPAALYCVSGTMCNQIAIQVHTRPGDEVILHEKAHPVDHEAGAPAALSGVALRLVSGERGLFTPAQLRAAIRPDEPYLSRSGLVMVENTHNMAGGTIWPLEALQAIHRTAREAGLPVHLDGARLWNASVASGVPERDYAAAADSVCVCFSKGLGAPVGSVLAGAADLIHAARRVRHRFGGDWRQAGLLAAGALHALEHHRERLAEDHAHAQRLAAGLRGMPGLKLPDRVETNIVLIELEEGMPEGAEAERRLAALGVSLFALGPRMLRAVLHMDVSREDVERAVAAFGALVGR